MIAEHRVGKRKEIAYTDIDVQLREGGQNENRDERKERYPCWDTRADAHWGCSLFLAGCNADCQSRGDAGSPRRPRNLMVPVTKLSSY